MQKRIESVFLGPKLGYNRPGVLLGQFGEILPSSSVNSTFTIKGDEFLFFPFLFNWLFIDPYLFTIVLPRPLCLHIRLKWDSLLIHITLLPLTCLFRNVLAKSTIDDTPAVIMLSGALVF
jgi:hypothetical protein